MIARGVDDKVQQMQVAMGQMTDALRLLDALGAPGEIGAHLDFAVARFGDWLGLDHQPPASVDALLSSLAFEAQGNGEAPTDPDSA